MNPNEISTSNPPPELKVDHVDQIIIEKEEKDKKYLKTIIIVLSVILLLFILAYMNGSNIVSN